jgi:hypothetical protein
MARRHSEKTASQVPENQPAQPAESGALSAEPQGQAQAGSEPADAKAKYKTVRHI